jgi:hypothetical protein
MCLSEREESCLFLAQPNREKRERGRKESKGVEEKKRKRRVRF